VLTVVGLAGSCVTSSCSIRMSGGSSHASDVGFEELVWSGIANGLLQTRQFHIAKIRTRGTADVARVSLAGLAFHRAENAKPLGHLFRTGVHHRLVLRNERRPGVAWNDLIHQVLRQ
jgi:hypothetical protein